MPKVKITRGTIVAGCHVDPGTVCEVKQHDALVLFHSGKAVPYAEEPEKPTTRAKPVTTKTAASTIKNKGKK